MWTYERENDTGYNDECFEEWWEVSNEYQDRVARCETEEYARLLCAAPEMVELLQSLVTSIKTTLRVGHERIIDLGGDCDSPETMIKGHWEIARVEELLKTLK